MHFYLKIMFFCQIQALSPWRYFPLCRTNHWFWVWRYSLHWFWR